MRSLLLIVVFYLVPTCLSFGQEPINYPRGYFWKDSVKIGEHIKYSLSYEYPAKSKLVFPDSSYNYFPFEYVNKEFFPTKMVDETTLRDSVIYTLATYELDSVFYLRIPIFLLDRQDSISYYSATDSVLFHPVVTEMPEQPELLAETTHVEVPTQFNYIYFLIGTGVVALILTTLIILFGKKLYRMYVVYKLKKSFEKYHATYSSLVSKLSNGDNEKVTHKLLINWKSYLEKLDRIPITKLTTKEIAQVYPNDNLKTTLKELDRSMYGGVKAENVFSLFGTLEEFSRERLNNKIEEVKNG